MGIQKELFAEFGNGHRDNLIFSLDAAETITCHFGKHADDVDTSTDKYFDLKSEAKKVHITVNKVASITHINGVALKSPRTLGTAAANVWSRGIEWNSITLKSDQASTNFEVYAS